VSYQPIQATEGEQVLCVYAHILKLANEWIDFSVNINWVTIIHSTSIGKRLSLYNVAYCRDRYVPPIGAATWSHAWNDMCRPIMRGCRCRRHSAQFKDRNTSHWAVIVLSLKCKCDCIITGIIETPDGRHRVTHAFNAFVSWNRWMEPLNYTESSS